MANGVHGAILDHAQRHVTKGFKTGAEPAPTQPQPMVEILAGVHQWTKRVAMTDPVQVCYNNTIKGHIYIQTDGI